jgi:hypothetical protein
MSFIVVIVLAILMSSELMSPEGTVDLTLIDVLCVAFFLKIFQNIIMKILAFLAVVGLDFFAMTSKL